MNLDSCTAPGREVATCSVESLPPRVARLRAARATIHGAASWSEADALAFAALVRLGTPGRLHFEPEGIGAPDEDDPGGVPTMRPAGDARGRLRGDALHLWRGLRATVGFPLPAPGAIMVSK